MRRRRLPTTLNRSTVPMIALFVASAHISFKGKHVLTNKGKYGLKAMVHLAGLEPGAIAPSHRNRRNEFDLEKILDHILTELRHAGFVYSRKGRGGGYALARPANEIRVGAIIRVLDGPLAPIPCASVTAFRPCTEIART
jgi:Rrf2 family protein